MKSDDVGRDDTALTAALRAIRADAFAPGFADRVLARMAADEPASLSRVLRRQFLYLAPAAVAAVLLLAALNIRTVGKASVTAALGIAPVTVTEAYSISALADLQPLGRAR